MNYKCLQMRSAPPLRVGGILDRAQAWDLLKRGRVQVNGGGPTSSKRVFVIDTRAQRKLLNTWIMFVIVKQHLVKIGRIDGHT